MVGNPEEHPPFATLIASDAPYTVLSKIPFPDATGLEQPLWDAELKGGRMLLTVPDEEGDKGKVCGHQPKRPEKSSGGSDLSDAALRLGARSRSIPAFARGLRGVGSNFLF